LLEPTLHVVNTLIIIRNNITTQVKANIPGLNRNTREWLPWLQIVDAETGVTMATANQSGEILVKTPAQFVGYWNNEDATRGSFDADGWFKTGCFQTSSVTTEWPKN